jgi:hypothetical protein
MQVSIKISLETQRGTSYYSMFAALFEIPTRCHALAVNCPLGSATIPGRRFAWQRAILCVLSILLVMFQSQLVAFRILGSITAVCAFGPTTVVVIKLYHAEGHD